MNTATGQLADQITEEWVKDARVPFKIALLDAFGRHKALLQSELRPTGAVDVQEADCE